MILFIYNDICMYVYVWKTVFFVTISVVSWLEVLPTQISLQLWEAFSCKCFIVSFITLIFWSILGIGVIFFNSFSTICVVLLTYNCQTIKTKCLKYICNELWYSCASASTGVLGGSVVNKPSAMQEMGLVPGSGRWMHPNPFQHSYSEKWHGQRNLEGP